MPWGIVETAPENEKIKADFADFLNGLNSCGDISYVIYSEIFDEGMKLMDKIYELGKSEASNSPDI